MGLDDVCEMQEAKAGHSEAHQSRAQITTTRYKLVKVDLTAMTRIFF